METQHIPAYLSWDAKGDIYVRIAPTLFPGKPDANSALIHRITAYSKAALWDDRDRQDKAAESEANEHVQAIIPLLQDVVLR